MAKQTFPWFYNMFSLFTHLPLSVFPFSLPPFVADRDCVFSLFLAADKWLFIKSVLDALQLWDALLWPEDMTYWCLSPTLAPDVNSLAWCLVRRTRLESFSVADQQSKIANEQRDGGDRHPYSYCELS